MVRRQLVRFWTYAIVACLAVAAVVVAGRALYKEISAPKKPASREARPKKAVLNLDGPAWPVGHRRVGFQRPDKGVAGATMGFAGEVG